eukprot:CAMPEP_0114524508 /NCGR_PEP_ID=MMETSP0109-20121206/21897_1 /TAXON_ID=29199 /ORGANISM="Chlorarachnion reptans, Strain CCCM449" /LENGTH=126 /DNA_ID=CAMNT_0001705965 /DNA_START=296 /DNA_END=676 /DNA_ORIENTATION=-
MCTTADDKLLLHGMEFYGYHGDLPAEQELGQKFLIDVDVWASLAVAQSSDMLSDTINYVEIWEITKNSVEQKKFEMIEALGGNIANRILALDSRIARVRVSVKKPQVCIPGTLKYVGIEMTRERSA